MNNNDLTSVDVKQKHVEAIHKIDTFKPQGLRKKAAPDYLETAEGRLYRQRLIEAAPDTSIDKILDRAIDQLMSGRDLPRMEVIDEPLVSGIPKGGEASPCFRNPSNGT